MMSHICSLVLHQS